MLLVFAGTYAEFMQWTRGRGQDRTDYVFIGKALDVLKYRGVPHIRIGTWYARRDAWLIEKTLVERQSEELEDA